MRISVVIPAYNAAATVVEAVQSALGQSYPPAEVIVVDDGSTDATASAIEPLPVRLIRQANAGVAAARNAGVRAAAGEAIAFLDADDVWHPRKLELQHPPLVQHQWDFLSSDFYDWPGATPTLADTAVTAVPIELSKLVIRNSIITSTVLVRAATLRGVGEFDTRMQGPEDYDLWLRLAQAARGATLPLKLTGYRSVAGSLSKNAERMEAGMKLILEKLDAAGVFRGKPLLRRKARGYFHYSCGYMHHQAGHRAEARQHLRQSLLCYPLGYSRSDVRYFLGRLRLWLKA